MNLYASLLGRFLAGAPLEDSECRQNQFAPISR
jgi:hypothetical protein